MDYAMTKTVDASYEEAVELVTEELKKVGFGILTEIDVKATLKKKLDVDFRRYIILGACNPTLAHSALLTEIELGLLLPCNVIVYEGDDGKTVVSMMNPELMVEVAKNAGELKETAAKAKSLLEEALGSL